MKHHLRQPDDPFAICPCCKQRWPDEDGDVERFLRVNTKKGVGKIRLAQILSWPIERLERFARRCDPPIDLGVRLQAEKEPEPSGA